jgi:enterochelin esterase-like enzyme
MSRRRITRVPRTVVINALLLVAVLALVDPSLAAPGAPLVSGNQPQSITCPSPSLGGQLPAMVYPPADYSSTGNPYPVIYFLQGLPAGPSAYQGYGYLAQAVSASRREAIVVVPQGARSAHSDREYLDWSPSENWPRAIARDLTTCIDARYHTIADRAGRALMGVSAGGYGAFNIGLRHLDTFGALESWSGYFAATNPSGTHLLKLGSAKANRAARVPRGAQLQRSLSRWPSLVAFYVGRSDREFFSVNQRFHKSLKTSGINHFYRTYPGGHSHSLWAREAPNWFALALDSLAKLGA